MSNIVKINDTVTDAAVNKFFEGITVVASQKGEQKVWHDFNWQGIEIVLVDSTHQRAWYYQYQNQPQVYEIEYDVLPEETKHQAFSTSLAAEESVDLFLNWNPHNIVKIWDLAFHELFHHVEQTDWQTPQASVVHDRYTPYPIQKKTHYYRQMIEFRLQSYLESHDQNDLKKAKYWFEKYQNEFPDHAQTLSYTDQSEGAAEYYGFVASRMALSKTILNQTNSQDSLLSFYKDYSQSFGAIVGSDAESYRLGLISSLILQTQDLNWQTKIETGKTPLEVLLQNVEAKQDEYAPEVKNQVDLAADQLNQKIINPLAFYASRQTDQYIAVFLPSESQKGTFKMHGAYSLTHAQHARVLINYSAVYKTPSGARVTLQDWPIVEDVEGGVLIHLPAQYFADDQGNIPEIHTRNNKIQAQNLNWKKEYRFGKTIIVVD